jgi:glutaredoxin
MTEHTTVVYTQPGCLACHRETKFLAQKGVEFEERTSARTLMRCRRYSV